MPRKCPYRKKLNCPPCKFAIDDEPGVPDPIRLTCGMDIDLTAIASEAFMMGVGITWPKNWVAEFDFMVNGSLKTFITDPIVNVNYVTEFSQTFISERGTHELVEIRFVNPSTSDTYIINDVFLRPNYGYKNIFEIDTNFIITSTSGTVPTYCGDIAPNEMSIDITRTRNAIISLFMAGEYPIAPSLIEIKFEIRTDKGATFEFIKTFRISGSSIEPEVYCGFPAYFESGGFYTDGNNFSAVKVTLIPSVPGGVATATVDLGSGYAYVFKSDFTWGGLFSALPWVWNDPY